MSLFHEILQGYDPEAELYDDPTALGNPRQTFEGIPADLKRGVIQDVQPEATGQQYPGAVEAATHPFRTVGAVGKNFAKGVGEFAAGMGAMLGEVLVHPAKSAGAVGGALAHPLDTARELIIDPLREKYTPKAGESIPSMVARNIYDDPFGTLIDASAIVDGPFSAMSKVSRVAGATRTADKLAKVAEIGKAMDPISIAMKAGRPVFKTLLPDAYARMRTSTAMADATAEETVRQRFLIEDYNKRLGEASAHLNPAEMMVRFPYAEGRVPIIQDDMITEITHRGMLESRKVQAGTAIRKDALDQFTRDYQVLQQEYERAANIAPEQYAELARAKAERSMTSAADFDPMNPENGLKLDEAYQGALDEATERSAKRAGKSTMTALDVAKEADFRARAGQLALDQKTFDLEEINSMLPRQGATSLDEALALMGGKGGVIVPHSAEVLTRDQSTVRNILTKVGEANVYKENTGAAFRSGLLDNLDPAAALSRSYRAAIKGDTFSKIVAEAMELGEKEGFVKRMEKGWNPNLDPEIRAGTHQPVHPASLHLDGSLQEHFEKVMTRLIETGADEQNLMELAEGMSRAADKTFPLNKAAKNALFKVPKAVGDELAFYKRSFEPATNPLAQLSDRWVMGPFNLLNLSAKATRLLNNGYGNTEFVAMQGLHPFSFRGLDALATAGRAMLGKYGVLTDDVSKKLAGVFDLPGVQTGGLSGTEAFERARDLGGRLAESPRRAVRMFGKYTQAISRANENLENIFRAGSLIYEMKPGGLDAARNLIHSAGSQANFAERIAELNAKGVEAMTDKGLKGAVKNMNRFLNNYDRTSAFDRHVARHVFPYHKFYKHSAELLLRFPFEQKVKGQLARGIGRAALQDVKDTLQSYGFDWNTMVPESMRNSVPITVQEGPDGSPQVVMLNTQGPNPFSFMAGQDVGEQGIAALHPLAKIAIEQATGLNLFTREKFQGALSTFSGRVVDPKTGAIVEDYNRPPLIEHYLRQFWPHQTLRELAAHGRVATDTADLIDLVRGGPGAYKQDKRGLARRRPQPFGPLTPLVRMIGPVPQTLQAPTEEQTDTTERVVSEQFTDLMQQHPELREKMMGQLRQRARSYRPGAALPARRF